MEVPSESFHWSSWDSRTCYPRRSNVGPGERFLRAQGWVMKLCSLVLESHANEKLRFQASKHATHDSRRVQTRLSSSLFSCLQPGLDWTRLRSGHHSRSLFPLGWSYLNKRKVMTSQQETGLVIQTIKANNAKERRAKQGTLQTKESSFDPRELIARQPPADR